MTFTDDDLKEWQSRLDRMGSRPVVGYPIDKWRALLSRLEAAERWIEIIAPNEYLGDSDKEAYEAWRKAAGK